METPNNVNEEKLPLFDTLVLSGGGVKGFNLLGGIQSLMDLPENIMNITTYIMYTLLRDILVAVVLLIMVMELLWTWVADIICITIQSRLY